jgi:hypothetical protein
VRRLSEISPVNRDSAGRIQIHRVGGQTVNRFLAPALASLLCAIPAALFAKGETNKITIQSLYLKAPIEIVDPVILSKFNVWTGPGTWSSDPAFNSNAPGFIIDWSSGTAPEVPDRLTCYKVSFYAKLPDERLVYVVYYAQDYYAHDPSSGRGYVYLPGRDDQSYSLNVGTIIRGVEGQWFHSSSTWDDIVVPFIKNARVGRNPSKPGLDPGEPGIISGTVVDSTGQPMHDAKVWVMRPRGSFHYIEADQNGRFRFGHLRPGNYNVYAVPADASPLPRWKQPVHLSRYKPIGKTTVQVGSEKNAG